VSYTLQQTTRILNDGEWQDVLDGLTPVWDIGNGISTNVLEDPNPADPLRVYRLIERP
jgi:hypothetical protein